MDACARARSAAGCLPGGGDLDQHALAADARCRTAPISRRARALRWRRCRRTAAHRPRWTRPGTTFRDLEPKRTSTSSTISIQRRAKAVGGHGLGQQRRVVRLLHRLEDQRRLVVGRAARTGQLVEVAGVGHHGGAAGRSWSSWFMAHPGQARSPNYRRADGHPAARSPCMASRPARTRPRPPLGPGSASPPRGRFEGPRHRARDDEIRAQRGVDGQL